jgi:DNA-binding SARP family transcriptional activator/tetratricopeptide (TPR) repeat protein
MASLGGERLEFSLLGPLEVTGEGGPVDLGAPKHRALLTLLLLEPGRVVSVDRLIDLLWHGEPPAAATATLQAYVSNLRRALEPDRKAGAPATLLVTRPPGYVLDITPEQVDVVRFERNLAAAVEAFEVRRLDVAAVAVADALSLWRGQPLADVAYEPWAQAEVERLRELHVAALETQLAVDLDRGRHASVAVEAERLAKEHPVRERFREFQMLALYRSGRQADALRVFQDARETLVEQLGIEPGPQLRSLEERILAQDPTLDWHGPPAGASTPEAPATPTGTQFVGRTHERLRLNARLAEACGGRSRLVLISGEPGIGKTRLCEELGRSAYSHGAHVVWARGWEGDGAPAFWPWVQVLRSLAEDTPPGELAGAVGRSASDLARVVADYAPYADGSDEVPDAETARFRFFEGVTLLLARLAARRPIVVILDDLHWADQSSLRLLEFAVGALTDAPILLAGTFRDSEARTPPLASSLAMLARTPDLERLALTGLSPEEVGAYVAAVVGDEADPRLADSLHDRTAGNPFFVGELVRLLRHEGMLGDAHVAPTVPEGVRDVIRTRLARLPEEALPVLTAGAVAGREFDVALVAHVCNIDEDRALDLVEAAWMTGIVDEAHDGLGHFRFSHELVRETLCEDLTALRRIRLHRRIGDAIEALHGERNPGFLTECAFHYSEAAPGGDAHKAVLYGQRAADRLVAQLAYAEAVPIYERALELVDTYGVGAWQTHVDLLIGLGWALRAAGRLADARAVLRRAMEQAGKAEDPVRIARAVLAIGGGSFWGYWDEIGVTDTDLVAYLERALEALEGDEEEEVLRCELLSRLAIEGYFSMPPERRGALADEALARARQLDEPVALTAALIAARLVHWRPDNLATRLEIDDELVIVSARAGIPFTELIGRHFRMIDQMEAGDRAAADADLAACERLAQRLDHHAFNVQLGWFRTMLALVDGRLDEGEELALATFESNMHSNPPAAKRSLGVQLFALRREQGRHGEVEALVRAAVDRQPHMDAAYKVGLAQLVLEQGRPDEARRLLDDVIEAGYLREDGGILMPVYATLIADVAAALRHEPAAKLVEPLLAAFTGPVCMMATGLCFGAVDRSRGDVARALGRLDEAIERYEAALDVEERLGARAYANRTRLVLALALAERNGPGDAERAADIANAVVRVGEELGTPTVVTAARQLLT